jgi:hypothetical protein
MRLVVHTKKHDDAAQLEQSNPFKSDNTVGMEAVVSRTSQMLA